MNKEITNQVYQYIDDHREDIVKDLMDVVRIESVTHNGDPIKPFG